MKKGMLLALFFIASLSVQAQVYFGNEWINSGQKYLKISINQAGVYRLNYQDIKNADAAFLETNPVHWQLLFRGKEVAIRVAGQRDGIFNEQDFIEFYAEGNDGSQDSLLYRPQKRLHPYQTLFSDISAYFLTINSALSGKRIAEINNSGQGLTPEKFHIEETVLAFTSEYTFNNLRGIEPALQQSYFEPGEGWTGKPLTADSVGIVQFKLTNLVEFDWPIKLEGMINGRDNLFHQIQIQLDTNPQITLDSPGFWGFGSQLFQATLPNKSIQNQQLTINFKPKRINGNANFSINYVKLSYPQAFDMSGQTAKVFHLPANSYQSALLLIQNLSSTTIAYDITDKLNCRYLTIQARDSQSRVVVSETARNRDVLLTNQFLKPLSILPVQLSFTFSSSINYLVITHASLKQSAIAYANYRTSSEGGGHKVLVVEADSLYDKFNYGERSPLAIRRFADFMLENTAIKNMLLIGKACSYPYYIKTAPDDLVPTIGYPGSDILLTAGLKGFSANTPAIPTGRLNVTTNEQVLAYLEKVKQLESTTPNGVWRKHIVHISGGKTQEEAWSLQAKMKNLSDIFSNGLLGGQVISFSKSNPYEKVEPVDIVPTVNEGVSLITFFGHAGPSITDMNFGFASPPQNGFRNHFYPLLIFNGCGVGEIFSRFNTLSTDWLLASEKGAAVVLAHSYYSYEEPTARYLTKLYHNLFANPVTLGLSLGKIQQQLNIDIEKEGVSLFDVAVSLQMILQGDPALIPYPLLSPDFAVEPKGIYIQSSVAGGSLKNSDSIQVVIPMTNLGKFVPSGSVVVSLKISGKTEIDKVLYSNAFRYRDTLRYTFLKDETWQRIEVTVDPNNQLVELSKANNRATLTLDWTQALGSSYPLNSVPDVVSPVLTVLINGAIKENNAIVDPKTRVTMYLVDENPLPPNNVNAVEVFLADCSTCSPQKIEPQLFIITSISANRLQVTANLDLKEGNTYQLIVFGKDAAGNRTRSPYLINLRVVGVDEPITFQAYPNPAVSYTKFELNLNVKELPTESQLTVYTLLGTPIFDTVFPLFTGKNTLFWQIKTPGHYLYKLRLMWKNGRSEVYTGKIVRLD